MRPLRPLCNLATPAPSAVLLDVIMARHWARAEEVVYVFSGLVEQLPLSQTHWERILENIQDQALTLQIKGEPSPEYKFSKFSNQSDKGFLGVASPEQAVLIVQAVSRITIGGVRFRGWREQELKTKHLVTIEIKNELATCRGGVAQIVEAMIKRNSLKGETISAWIENGNTLAYKVFIFFADDVLYQELLLRRNGPPWCRSGVEHLPVCVRSALQSSYFPAAQCSGRG
jgi:hypothetical protein